MLTRRVTIATRNKVNMKWNCRHADEAELPWQQQNQAITKRSSVRHDDETELPVATTKSSGCENKIYRIFSR